MVWALVVAVGVVSHAVADNLNKNWDNGTGDNNFGNPVNWDNNTLPTTGTGNAGDNIRIDLTGASKAVYSVTLDNPGSGRILQHGYYHPE